MFLTQKITRKKLKQFLVRHRSNEKVLDIGASKNSYKDLFPNKISMDIDPENDPDIIGDAHKLPFSDNEFEMILCTEVLEHLTEPHVAIKEMERVLKPEGKIILTTRFMFPLHEIPYDYFRYTKYGLEHLFKDWEVKELIPETTNFETLAVLFQRLAYQSEFRLNFLFKVIVFTTAYLLKFMNFIIQKQFGNIKKDKEDVDVLTTGYYLVASVKK